MTSDQTVLLLGATGRTGGRTAAELLGRGCRVRAPVRDLARLPPAVAQHPHLSAVEADLRSLDGDTLRHLADGAEGIVSCLGHTLTLAGIFGPPRDLVTWVVTQLCAAVVANGPAAPVKFALMSSVSVHRGDDGRAAGERAFLAALRCVLPPARDNQRAADVLFDAIGPDHPAVQWVVVRPDTLVDGDTGPYTVHEHLTNPLRAPAHTAMANVAHFLAELATDRATWERWRGRAPVIVDAGTAARR